MIFWAPSDDAYRPFMMARSPAVGSDERNGAQ